MVERFGVNAGCLSESKSLLLAGVSIATGFFHRLGKCPVGVGAELVRRIAWK